MKIIYNIQYNKKLLIFWHSYVSSAEDINQGYNLCAPKYPVIKWTCWLRTSSMMLWEYKVLVRLYALQDSHHHTLKWTSTQLQSLLYSCQKLTKIWGRTATECDKNTPDISNVRAEKALYSSLLFFHIWHDIFLNVVFYSSFGSIVLQAPQCFK